MSVGGSVSLAGIDQEVRTVIKKGSKVESLTRKAGQVPRRGTVENVRGDTVEVRWDDGRVSVISREALVPARRE